MIFHARETLHPEPIKLHSSILSRMYQEAVTSRRSMPFIMYSGGPVPIVRPRGIKGWAQVAVWLALLAPLVLWFEGHLGPVYTSADKPTAIFLFCTGLVVWLIAGIWWVVVHSEVVPLVEVRRERQYRRRQRHR